MDIRDYPKKRRRHGHYFVDRQRRSTYSPRAKSLERRPVSQKKQILTVCLLLAAATFAVFWQVRLYDFVNLDDKMYIVENRHVLSGLTIDGVKWAFTSFHASNWHPLTWLSHMLDIDLFGVNAGRMHLVNVFFHIAGALLLFLILHRMTGAVWRSAFVAALFALHPLHVESVAWIAERKDVLSAFFWMLTLGAYVLYVEKKHPGRYLAALFFFALGLMAKPMLVTLPFVLLLLDVWPLNRLRAGESARVHGVEAEEIVIKKDKGRKKRKAGEPDVKAPVAVTQAVNKSMQWSFLLPLVREKIPFFVLSAASSLITIYAQQQGAAVVSMERIPLFTRMANALMSYILYIGKAIWPRNLAVFYPYPDAWPLWQIGGALLLLSGITAMAVYFLKRLPAVAVGWFWYLGTLVPVIGILQVGMQAMADRYTYIPLIGLFIMAAWGAPELLKKWRPGKAALAAAAMLIVAGLAAFTWTQAGHWRDSVRLFSHALAVTKDNHLAHNNLGVALNAAGEKERAAFHYAEAVRLNPRYSSYHYNYANHLVAQGRAEEAISHYTEAIRLEPDYFNAHNNLALARAARREFKEAAFHFREALRIRPGTAGVHYNLAVVLANQSDRREAERHLREAVRLEPNFAEAHNDLGMVLAMQGKTQEGIVHFREALRLKPGYAAANHNLRLALQSLDRKR
jgi:Flp pilus assembly protein TadD